jgi:heparan-alpha-glucosaminide N-acetyltransferase
VIAGRLLLAYQRPRQRIQYWLCWGVLLGVFAGVLCGFSQSGGPVPVNKNLWSLSFITTVASGDFILLSFFYLVCDVLQWWTGAPLKFVGMNSILIYCGHELLRVRTTHPVFFLIFSCSLRG